MRATQCVILVLGLAAMLVASPAPAVYYSETFDSYTTDAEVTAAGWVMANVSVNPAVYDDADWEPTSIWTITNPDNCLPPPGRNGELVNPDPSNKFMISDSNKGGPKDNPFDTGASHDLTSPVFSTVGADPSNLWLHVNVNTVDNDNAGRNVFMVDTSVDGGATWTNVWIRVGAGRGTSGPRKYPGGEPGIPTTYLPTHSNTGAYFGELDVNLGAIAGESTVKLRFRHYEPSDDFQYMIDNLVVDEVAPRAPLGSREFGKEFSGGSMAGMTIEGVWGAVTPINISSGGAPYETYVGNGPVLDRCINRIGHPSPIVEFACASDGAGWLMTPLMDFSDDKEVVLAFEDEFRAPRYYSQFTGEVLLMQDNGNGYADSGDTLVATVFKYDTTAFHRGDEDSYYAERVFDVPEAAGLSNAFFAWHSELPAVGGISKVYHYFWCVDNIEVTVPEPSTFALLLGAVVMGWIAYRRRG